MRISPIAPQAPTAAPEGLNVRAFKMTTNATPGRVTDPEQSTEHTSEAPAADEDTQPLSPQFAALAKQRRALQVKEREIQDKLKELESRSATQAGGVDVARLKSDPLGVLLEAGVTYDQLTEAVLASQDGNQTRALEAKIKALEEGIDKRFTDKATQEEQAALDEMGRDAQKIADEEDEFELIRLNKSIPDVKKLIHAVWKAEGKVLPLREAMQEVEKAHQEDFDKLLATKRAQAKFAPPPPAPPATQTHRPQMRTLTNRDTASVPMSAKARALAAFNGTLRR